MGWFQRTFLNTPEARIERAERYLKVKHYNNARLELLELDEPVAKELLCQALAGLVDINLQEAEARFSSGDYSGANEHLLLAKNFGATQQQVNQVKKIGKEYQKQKREEDILAAQKKKKIDVVGNDPIWSLPADDPRLRYAIHLDGYPLDLQERLLSLGQEFSQATLSIEEGNPKKAFTIISNFVEREPVVSGIL